MLTDITSDDDIHLMVHTFYDRVRKDPDLGSVFEAHIRGNWDPHLNRMCDFWSTIILYTKKYQGDPMSKHFPLPLNNVLFGKWLTLFNTTVDELFAGEHAQTAKNRAASIANIMQKVLVRQ